MKWREALSKFHSFLPVVFAVLIALIAISQFGFLSGQLVRTSTSAALMNAQDVDAATAIETAVRTRLWNDNRFRPYGPLYYRVAHPIARLAPLPALDGETPQETTERSHHFALTLVSLVALFLVCYLIATLVSNSWPIRGLVVVGLVSLFCNNQVWIDFVLRAHPDYLLALFVAGGLLSTFRLAQDPKNSRTLKLTALLWACALSTKMITIFFLPALVLMFAPPFKKHQLSLALQFYKKLLPYYFIVGFPQNLIFWESLKFLSSQSNYSGPMTLGSLERWITLFKDQFWLAGIFVFFCSLIAKPQPVPNHTNALLRALGVWLFAFLMLLSRNVYSQHDYYTIPFIASILVLMALSLREVLPRFYRPWSIYCLQAIGLVGAVGILYKVGVRPDLIEERVEYQLRCRTEAAKVLAFVRHLQFTAPASLHLDPYVPFVGAPASHANVVWSRTLDSFPKSEQLTFVTRRDYYNRYLVQTPSRNTLADSPDYIASYKFYTQLAPGRPWTDSVGRRWTLKQKDACGWEIWWAK